MNNESSDRTAADSITNDEDLHVSPAFSNTLVSGRLFNSKGNSR